MQAAGVHCYRCGGDPGQDLKLVCVVGDWRGREFYLYSGGSVYYVEDSHGRRRRFSSEASARDYLLSLVSGFFW